jgi:hypothetical protein
LFTRTQKALRRANPRSPRALLEMPRTRNRLQHFFELVYKYSPPNIGSAMVLQAALFVLYMGLFICMGQLVSSSKLPDGTLPVRSFAVSAHLEEWSGCSLGAACYQQCRTSCFGMPLPRTHTTRTHTHTHTHTHTACPLPTLPLLDPNTSSPDSPTHSTTLSCSSSSPTWSSSPRLWCCL